MPPDHFSKQAAVYAQHRPLSPKGLIDYLVGLVESRQTAWDCGTGNGQTARLLADHFKTVIATDLSADQIAHAEPHPRIRYRVAVAEDSGVASDSVDLITVSQAFHWFDFEKFFKEVRRVSRPNAVIAVWCYGLHHITPEVDAVAEKYYSEIVGAYWPPEVKWVREKYLTIPFPFEEIKAPPFVMEQDWTLDQVIGNFVSWSSTQYYRKDRGQDPIDLIRNDLLAAWGDPKKAKRIRWDICLRVGRIVR